MTHFLAVLILSLQLSMMWLHSDITWLRAAEKLRVQIFYLAQCSNSLTIGGGTLPKGAPEGLGEMQIFAKFVCSSFIFFQSRGLPFCTTYQWQVSPREGFL